MKFIILSMLCFSSLNAFPSRESLEEFESVLHIVYKKHTYLIFGGRCIVHDPDCTCHWKWKGLINESNTKIKFTRDFLNDN